MTVQSKGHCPTWCDAMGPCKRTDITWHGFYKLCPEHSPRLGQPSSPTACFICDQAKDAHTSWCPANNRCLIMPALSVGGGRG